MSKDKLCCTCDGEVLDCYYGYAGNMGWMCEDCIDVMKGRFRKIFGIDLCGTTAGSDLAISLDDLHKLLAMIHRNSSMLRYEIDDHDRCVSGGSSDGTV